MTQVFSPHARALLSNFYGDKDPSELFHDAAYGYGSRPELAARIEEYATKGWFMFASPVLSNVKQGLPISCFLSYVPDTVDGLIQHQSEFAYMSVMGGGVGGHWSDVRGADTVKAPGIIPFMKVLDAEQESFRQGRTRKGSYASYLDVSHPEIEEFLGVRTPSGGDANRKCLNMNIGVNISDNFMDAVISGKEWDFICPHTGERRGGIAARKLWEAILETRFRTGEPYLHFIDTSNDWLNQWQKQKGLKIRGSNLCSEVLEITDENRSAVCCLSSLNLEMWDEWKDTGIVEDLIEFLDDVLQSFIDRCKARDILQKARYSAEMERSLGLGTMGFHSLLQKKNIPFEGVAAIGLNRKIFKIISERARESSRRLAKERGEPQDLVGSGRRNANLLAIAPNSNSSILLGTSPSIEPWSANEFVSRTRAGVFLERNKYLAKLLDQKGLKWEDCVIEGSVQQCEHLTEAEKAVFKTAWELDQVWIIEHAAKRQEFICQGQSLNLFIGKGYSRTQFSKLHIRAWESGLKTLYYCRVDPKTQAKITIQKESKEGGCVSCEG